MNKKKLNIPMFAALMLLLLTMVTTHFTSGLYARYTSTGNSRSTAMVAKFDVEGTVTENTDGTYKLTVTNNSQVTVKYSVTVEMDKRLKAIIGSEEKTLADGETAVTFTNSAWELKPETATVLTMEFEVADWAGITDRNSRTGETEEIALGFTVKVTAEQVD